MPSDEPNPIEFLDPEHRRTAEHRYSRLLLLIYGIGALVVLIAMGTVYISFLRTGNGDNMPARILLISTGVILAVLVVNYAAFWLLRRRGVWWAQPSPLLALRFKDRRRLVKALRRDEPAPADMDPSVAHASMRWLARMRAYLLIMPCIVLALLVLNTVMQELRSHSTFLLVYNGFLAVLVMVVVIRRNRPVTQNARRRLHNTASPDS